MRGFPVDELDAGRHRARVRRVGPEARHAGEPGRAGELARPRARSGRAAHRPGGQALLDDPAAGLPHRRRRHHRAALPAARPARRREPHRQRGGRLQRDPRRVSARCSKCCTSRCTGTATTSSPPARRRTSSCRSSTMSTERPRIFYIGWYIRDAQRHPTVPRLTGDQLAAMDLVETVANDPAFMSRWTSSPATSSCSTTRSSSTRARPTTTTKSPSASATCCGSGCARTHFSSVEDDAAGRHPEAFRAAPMPLRTDDDRDLVRRASAEAVGTALLVGDRGGLGHRRRSGSRPATSDCSCSRTRPPRVRDSWR